ncbi:MAG: type II secretion system F family protein [Paracoccaceae bacterium]
MPIYRYEGIDSHGQVGRGTVTADTEALALENVQALGLLATRIDVETGGAGRRSWYLMEIGGANGRLLSLAEQASLATQLAVLFRAKLPLTAITDILAQSAESRRLQMLFARIGVKVADGAGLGAAFEAAGAVASPMFLSMLHLASTAADPDAGLAATAELLRKQSSARQNIIGALIYPGILIAAAFGVVGLISLFLAPNLVSMYEAMARPVPFSIALFVRAGAVAEAYGFYVIFALLGLGLVAAASWNRRQAIHLRRRVAEGLPVVGPILRLSDLCQLTQCTGLLTRTGLPLAAALRTAATGAASARLRQAFTDAAAALEQGGRAAAVFGQVVGLPSVFPILFRVGEEANRLDEILPALAGDLEDRLARAIERMIRLLTPVLTLVIGGGIALLAYTVMGAIVSVNDLAR